MKWVFLNLENEVKNHLCAFHDFKGLLVKASAPELGTCVRSASGRRILPEFLFECDIGVVAAGYRPSERNTESLSFPLKATHDLIKYEVEVMDGFISKRQHPSEIRARPGLQMDS